MDLIRSVQRACGLLDVFTPATPRLTLGELSDRAGLPKPTVYRLAVTLVDAGFMTQHPDGRYGLGVRLMEIGAIARADIDLLAVCVPVMEQLREQTEETILLGLAGWETLEITIIHRLDSSYELSVVSPVGRRSPIVLGALGKALLSGLNQADLIEVTSRIDLAPQTERTISDREQLIAEIGKCRSVGFATDSGEFAPGVSAVAAPVTLGSDRPVATIGVVGPSNRLDERLGVVGRLVRDALLALHGHS